jgi:hypothetical protein
VTATITLIVITAYTTFNIITTTLTAPTVPVTTTAAPALTILALTFYAALNPAS